MKLKICGIRNDESLRRVDGACDFVGLNFSKTSKRSINIGDLVNESRRLKKSKIVGVFYKNDITEILESIEKYDFFAIQIHNEIDFDDIKRIKDSFNGEIWLAKNAEYYDFRSEKFKKICEKVDMILFDGKISGSGIENDLEKVNLESKIIAKKFGVAGGINSENILKFMRNFPDANLLDLASGVETEGEFDEKKLVKISKIFYENVK